MRSSPGSDRLRDLVAVYASNFGVGLAFGFQPPLLAFRLERAGATSLQVGALNSASTLAVIACGALYPRLISRLGLRGSALTGTALGVLMLLAMPLFESTGSWLVLRVGAGCALGLEWIASEIWLNALATERTRGRVMATYGTVFAAGVFSGPLLLGLTGSVGARPFIAGALGMGVMAVPLLFIRDPAGAGGQGPARLDAMSLLRSAPLVMLTGFIAGLLETTDLSLLPLYGLQLGANERLALLLLTGFLAGNVLLQLPIGWLADRIGRTRALSACALISVLGPLALGWAMRSSLILWSLLLLWGGTMYAFYTQGMALLGDSARPQDLPRVNTAFVVIYCAGGIAGPLLGGLAMDVWRPHGLILVLSGSAAILLVALLRAQRNRMAGASLD